MNNLYIDLDQKMLKSREQEALQNSKKMLDLNEPSLLFPSEKTEILSFQVADDGMLKLELDAPNLGYLELKLEITDAMIISLLTYSIKRLNKFKALIETISTL